MSPIYTKTGDTGTSGLWGGSRLPKADVRFDVIGTIDETQAAIGLARSSNSDAATDSLLDDIQNDLYRCNAEVAQANDKIFTPISQIDIAKLEKVIDDLQPDIEQSNVPMSKFIRPGGPMIVTSLHLARTVCRRAERLLWALHTHERGQNLTGIRPEVLQYINRLSDTLFQLARKFTI